MSKLPRRIDRRTAAPTSGAEPNKPSLTELLTDGFQAMFLLQGGCKPKAGSDLAEHVIPYLAKFDSKARQLGYTHEDIQLGKYAFCAAFDEVALGSKLAACSAWETRPLQLRLFGDQLAGEHFFEKLEELRAKGSLHLAALEVFHLCLLMGFRGRFALNERDKLNVLCARLGDEISRMKGKAQLFAPHAERPDRISQELDNGRNVWMLVGGLLISAMLVFGAMRWRLHVQQSATLTNMHALVKAPSRPPTLLITLP